MTSGPENARELLGRGAEVGLRLVELPQAGRAGRHRPRARHGRHPVVLRRLPRRRRRARTRSASTRSASACRSHASRSRSAVPGCRIALVQPSHPAGLHPLPRRGARGRIPRRGGQPTTPWSTRAIEVAAGFGDWVHPAPFEITRRNIRAAEVADGSDRDLAVDLASSPSADPAEGRSSGPDRAAGPISSRTRRGLGDAGVRPARRR